jgi:NADPH2:quinone reductase
VEITTSARAVAHLRPGPPDVLEDVEIDVPSPTGHDLLVEVRAVSVNPADVKVRASADPGGTPKFSGTTLRVWCGPSATA